MDTQPITGLPDLVARIALDTAEAVSVRPGESRQRQNERAQNAVAAVMTFQPHDVAEAMIAGQCVMLHEIIVDNVQRLLCGEDGPSQRASRAGIVAMDKLFGSNLDRLDRRRRDRTDVAKTTQSLEERTETEIADRIRRHRMPAEPRAQSAAAQSAPPSPSVVVQEPELLSEDPRDDGWPNTPQMAALNRQARRALDRQTGKRAGDFPRSGVMPDRNAPATTTSATAVG